MPRNTVVHARESLRVFHCCYAESCLQGPLSLLTAFSDHQLGLFVLANLLTGAVNMCMDTKAQKAWVGLCTVALYCAMLAITAGALHKHRHRARTET